MLAEVRQQEILDIINEKGSIKCSEIQKKFNVGYETAKRDLFILDKSGLVKKVYGGAVKNDDIQPRYATGKSIEDLVSENDFIYLDNSSYSSSILDTINIKCRVAANSIEIAYKSYLKGCKTYLSGLLISANGVAKEAYNLNADNKIFDKVFISCKGITRNGLFTNDDNALESIKKACELGQHIICSAKSESIGLEWNYKIADVDMISKWIIDNSIIDNIEEYL